MLPINHSLRFTDKRFIIRQMLPQISAGTGNTTACTIQDIHIIFQLNFNTHFTPAQCQHISFG